MAKPELEKNEVEELAKKFLSIINKDETKIEYFFPLCRCAIFIKENYVEIEKVEKVVIEIDEVTSQGIKSVKIIKI